MLFMVIEQFKDGNPEPIRARFIRHGRMMPEGVIYRASWLDPAKVRCFQVMEAPDIHALKEWTGRWADLIDFEIAPVVTSQEYWVNPSESH